MSRTSFYYYYTSSLAIDHDREVSNLSAFNVPDPEAELAIVLKKAQTNEAVERENARLGRRLEEMRSTGTFGWSLSTFT